MLALGPMGAQGPEQGMIAARPVCPVDRYAPESLMTIEFSVTNNVFARDILTVAQLNQAVGQLLERSIPAIWVRGEISNFTQAASGHWYFTIRTAAPPCGRSCSTAAPARVGFVPRAGDQVEIRARVSLYEPRGDYQLQVDAMRRAGLGNLYEAFLRLKEQLAFEGLFDPARKRELAPLPGDRRDHLAARGRAARCAVGTGPARAASSRHHLSGPVQGADAAGRLAAQVRLANQRAEVDTLLLVRGGGSIEDLWSFNDEALAREVAASAIPVVSGVGHETDFTIVDFVADLRAPTRPRRRNWPAPARRAAGPRHGRGAHAGARPAAAAGAGRPAPRPRRRPAGVAGAAPGTSARAPEQPGLPAGVRLVRAARRAQRASPCSRNAWNIASPTRAARQNVWRTPRGNWARPTRGCACRRATGWPPPARSCARWIQAIRWRGDMRLPATRRGRILRDAASLQPGQALELRLRGRRAGRSHRGPAGVRRVLNRMPGPAASARFDSLARQTHAAKSDCPSPACWPLER